jgi:hypothetical protein
MIIPEQGEIMKNRLTGDIFEVKKITDQFVILYSVDGSMQIMTGKKSLINSFDRIPQDETRGPFGLRRDETRLPLGHPGDKG